GDSIHPTMYLCVSTATNIVLDILFVAVFKWDVAGAAVATVLAQGLSAGLCIIKMLKQNDYTKLDFKLIKFNPRIMKEIVRQGLPTGVQNSVISIGNIVVQSNINSFGKFAMSGYGAYVKIEGFVFLPITSMSMTLPTFVSQNLGAGKIDRAKKSTLVGILSGMAIAELIGLILYIFADPLIRIFINDDLAVGFGITQARTVSFFFCLLAFSHCAAGALRGCGKAYIPMATMLTFWCVVRVTYVTLATNIWPEFRTISWAYPITWSCSTIVFLICLLTQKWDKLFSK
ncbi:MAG: polysaccharide biosynthesis C-terminal domain-containing protein, partial [Lachnospiraceae bacterium]|nr:polysaccharide biosynthesis C-terminal domain-containing protein [Lachnospiraceae bacterium]